MSIADLLRLLVIPGFGWIALEDLRTRRVPARVWYPILAVGAVAFGIELLGRTGGPGPIAPLVARLVISVALVGGLAFAFYWIGAFGGADAKAMATLAVVFPVYPTYTVLGTELPLVASTAGVFSLTIITDAVLVGALYPLAVAGRNLRHGRLSPAMFVARPIERSALVTTPGKLLEDPGGATLAGLDLDALRMYLRWRGVSLATLCGNPETFRRASTLPDDPNEPTDGAVDPAIDPDDGGAPPASFDGGAGRNEEDATADPWGAAQFLDSIDGSAYGTDAETLRDALDLLADREVVWVSPGLPFLVPLFVGLVVAVLYGDLMFAAMGVLGIV